MNKIRKFTALYCTAHLVALGTIGNTWSMPDGPDREDQVQRLLQQNQQHDSRATAAGGIISSCQSMADYQNELYQNQEDYHSTFLNQSMEQIERHLDSTRNVRNRLKNSLPQGEKEWTAPEETTPSQEGEKIDPKQHKKAAHRSQGDLNNEERAFDHAHSLSRCSGTGSVCHLSGPLFQEDEKLTQLTQASLQQVIQLADARTNRLIDLQLQQWKNADFLLYQEALLPGRGKVSPSKIKLFALSATAVQKLKCRRHPLSEVDSKAYHLFRAASATYLISQVAQASHHRGQALCRLQENYTDESHDTQIRTVERAANLIDLQIQNLCLRITPTSEKLKKECEKHMARVLGKENLNQPKTLEQALNMYQMALQAASTESKTKREKIQVSHQNIIKGRAWKRSVEEKMKMAMAISLIAASLSKYFAATAWGAPKAAYWLKVSARFSGLYSFYQLYERSRAVKFIKKWKTRYTQAKHFSHLICNFKEAEQEEEQLQKRIEKIRNEELKKLGENQQKILQHTLNYARGEEKNPTPWSQNNPVAQNAQASDTLLAQSLSMAKGSLSFQDFLLSLNEEWKKQSNDLSTSHNFQNRPLLNLKEDHHKFDRAWAKIKEEDRTGFPLPETRIFSIQTAIKTVEENIQEDFDYLDPLVDHRNEYLDLLHHMRKRMPLDQQGLDTEEEVGNADSPEETPGEPLPPKNCLQQLSSGHINLDPRCDCIGAKNCATFQIPYLGSLKLNPKGGSQLTFNGDKSLRKQLRKGRLTGGRFFSKKAYESSRKRELKDRLFQKSNGSHSRFSAHSPHSHLKSKGNKIHSNSAQAFALNTNKDQLKPSSLDPSSSLSKNHLAIKSKLGEKQQNLFQGQKDKFSSSRGKAATGEEKDLGINYDGYYEDLNDPENQMESQSLMKTETNWRDLSSTHQENGEQSLFYSHDERSLFKIISRRYQKTWPRLLIRKINLP